MDNANVDREAAIKERCAALGLTLQQAQAMADSGPFPYSKFPHDLAFMLGLDPTTFALRPSKAWLWIAARSASTSYRGYLSPELLQQTLVTGNVPAEFAAHISCFMDEVAMHTFLLAIEQAALQTNTPISDIWCNVVALHKRTSSYRCLPVA